MVNLPNFEKVIGDAKQTEVVPRILSQEAAQPTKPKEEPKKAAPPAEEPKLAKEEKATKLDEEVEAPKPKAKYPIDFLPPSPMVLDEWKRLYSNINSNIREVVIKGIFNCFLYSCFMRCMQLL